MKRYFLRFALSYTFKYYQEPKRGGVDFSDVVMIDDNSIENIKDYIIEKYGSVTYMGHTYNPENVSYKLEILSLNLL